MNESSIQVTIAGRTYPLTVADGEAKSVRDAAGRIDEIVQRFQRDYGVSDRQDLLAMAASAIAERLRPQPPRKPILHPLECLPKCLTVSKKFGLCSRKRAFLRRKDRIQHPDPMDPTPISSAHWPASS